jgi:hypothetical protein
MNRIQHILLSLTLAVGLLLAAAVAASAHERRVVAGKYQFVVGFINEPAYADSLNAVDLTINEQAGSNPPVEGADKTLKAEIVVGPNKLPVELRPRFRMPGKYAAYFMPTKEGAYTFHFFGTIGNDQVDESFTSSPTGFDEVKALQPLQFPLQHPAVEAVQRDLTQQAAARTTAADEHATLARNIALGGVAVGVLGLALAVWALLQVMALRRHA